MVCNRDGRGWIFFTANHAPAMSWCSSIFAHLISQHKKKGLYVEFCKKKRQSITTPKKFILKTLPGCDYILNFRTFSRLTKIKDFSRTLQTQTSYGCWHRVLGLGHFVMMLTGHQLCQNNFPRNTWFKGIVELEYRISHCRLTAP